MLHRIWRNNGLTITLMALFISTWAGQTWTGLRAYNDDQRLHGKSEVTLRNYLKSGHFWEATGENWESEFLQMAMFVVLTCFLFQKGSPESKDPDEINEVDENPREHKEDASAPLPVRRGGPGILWLYSNSLSMCFAALFLVSIAIHAAGGLVEQNEERREHGQTEISIGQYVTSNQFWFESLQNWQSEFLSLAAMVYLSVYLRQQGSAESKRVAAGNDQHE